MTPRIDDEYLPFISRHEAALIVQSQMAEDGQLAPTGHRRVVRAIHVLKKLVVAAQAAGDWIPGRRRYPLVHRKRPARFCLDVPDDGN